MKSFLQRQMLIRKLVIRPTINKWQYYYFSSLNRLTVDQAHQTGDAIIANLYSNESKIQLNALKDDGNTSIVMKWQQLLHVCLPIQLAEISKLGYDDSQKGLNEYNKDWSELMKNMKNDNKVQQLHQKNQDKWKYLLKEAIGIDTDEEFIELTPKECEEKVKIVCDGMQSETFLNEIDEHMNKFIATNLENEVVEKRKYLLNILIPLHIKLLNLNGEKQWVLTQRAIMDHAHNEQILDMINKATQTVFTRAGIM